MKENEKKYVLVKDASKGFVKGGIRGAGIAGFINTACPALIPTFAGMITGASKLSTIEKISIGFGLASNPALQISNLAILGIGTGIGAIIGAGYSLVKNISRSYRLKKEQKNQAIVKKI